jgi:rubredoxin
VQAERVVSAGKGIGDKKNMKLIEQLAKAAGAAIGSSRPVAETLKYLPLNRYVGMSGQKFTGNLYIACGISGAGQHLKGIKDASTIVAINIERQRADLQKLRLRHRGRRERDPAPADRGPRHRQKAARAAHGQDEAGPDAAVPSPSARAYICSGCGYEYVPELGDPDSEIAPGTQFKDLPEGWVCPECAEARDQFIERPVNAQGRNVYDVLRIEM